MRRIDLLDIGFHVSDEFLQIFRLKILARQDQDRRAGQKNNRREILFRMVGEAGVKRDRCRVGAHMPRDQRISVIGSTRGAGGLGIRILCSGLQYGDHLRIARDFFRPRHFPPRLARLAGLVDGHVLRHRHRAGVDAHQHALVGARVHAEGRAAHAGDRVLRLHLELLLALDDAGHLGPEVPEEQLRAHLPPGRPAAKVRLGEL